MVAATKKTPVKKKKVAPRVRQTVSTVVDFKVKYGGYEENAQAVKKDNEVMITVDCQTWRFQLPVLQDLSAIVDQKVNIDSQYKPSKAVKFKVVAEVVFDYQDGYRGSAIKKGILAKEGQHLTFKLNSYEGSIKKDEFQKMVELVGQKIEIVK